MNKYGILGSGAWGSAISTLIEDGEIIIWTRNIRVMNSINNLQKNPYLKKIKLNNNVKASNLLKDLDKCNYLFLTLPVQHTKNILKSLKKNAYNKNFILCSKGIDIKNNKVLSEIVKEIFPRSNIAILSGPSFADEVAQKKPTAVTVSCKNKKYFDEVKKIIKKKYFRIYYSNDIIGSQLGGAIKNVYAIGAGIIEGLNLGKNAKSAYISRSFAEILRLGKKMKAKEKTFFGLAGLGDLILTCNSVKSRNYFFGLSVATYKEKNISKLIMRKKILTEGYYTTKALYKLSKKYNVEMPIAKSIYKILYEKNNIKNEIKIILNRSLKEEFY